MKRIQIDTHEIQGPENYREFSIEAYLFALDLIVRGKSKHDFLLLLFLKVTGIKVGQLNFKSLEIELPTGELVWVEKKDFYHAVGSINFIIDETDGKLSLSNSFAVQLMPNINIGDQVYYGPTTAFSNVIWGEFIMLQTYYSRYLIYKDKKWLYHLMAVLYRPFNGLTIESAEFKGDLRIAYNSGRDEHMALFWEKNSTDVHLMAVSHYVIGGLSALRQMYPKTFSSVASVSSDTDVTESKKIQDPFINLISLTDSLAADATKMELITNTNVHFVCRRIEAIKAEEKKLRKSKN